MATNERKGKTTEQELSKTLTDKLQPSAIKADYESNANTNAHTDAEKTKLSGIAAGAQVNTVTLVAGKTGAVSLVAGAVVKNVITPEQYEEIVGEPYVAE